MEPQDPNAPKTHSRSSFHLLLVIFAIIVLSIAAFLILRPNPSGTTPKNGNTSSPAPAAPSN
jgi:hypothetical protein